MNVLVRLQRLSKRMKQHQISLTLAYQTPHRVPRGSATCLDACPSVKHIARSHTCFCRCPWLVRICDSQQCCDRAIVTNFHYQITTFLLFYCYSTFICLPCFVLSPPLLFLSLFGHLISRYFLPLIWTPPPPVIHRNGCLCCTVRTKGKARTKKYR